MYTLNKDYYPYFQFKPASIQPAKGKIFFIHGYAVNSYYHNNFSDRLQDYDYYAVELPGHGITPLKSKKQLKPYAFALEVVNLINKLNLKDIILMGHSMGGGIAMMVSQMIPERIKKLVIVTPMNSRGTTKIFNFLFKMNPKNERQIDVMYDILMCDYENNKNLITEYERQTVMRMQNELKKNFKILKHNMASIDNMVKLNFFEKNLKKPTLLIVGKYDDCINWKTTSKNLSRKNPNIIIYEFQKSGHLPFVEQPEEYFESIMKFIEDEVLICKTI